MHAPQPEALFAQQREFVAHLRDPERYPPPGDVPLKRMALYRELLLNNVTATLDETFTVARSLIPKTAWRSLVNCFFAEHRSRTPILARLPGEFAAWYAGNARAHLPGWLGELLLHEWRLLERLLADAPVPDWVEVTDVLSTVPRLSPLARLDAYRYPVHLIGPECRPEAPETEPTQLALWRDRHDQVRALALNPASARLLALIAAEEGHDGRQFLERIASELHHPAPGVVFAGGANLLERFYRHDLLVAAEQ